MSRTRATGVAAVAALALAAAACGGDDDTDQFREDYNAAVERLSKVDTDIGQAAGGTTGQSNAAVAKEFRGIAETTRTARARLAQLEPPEGARQPFDRLLSVLDRRVDDLEAVADAARKGDPEAASEAGRSLSRSGQEITEAEKALQRAVDG